jgi:hypothetical protein
VEKPVIGINSLPRNWQAGKSLSNGLAPPGFARGTVSQRYEVSPPQVGRWSPDAFGSLFRLSISSSSRLRDRRPEPVLGLCRASQCSCRRYADVGGMHQAGGLVIVSIAADLARFFSQLDPAARRSPPFRDRKFADSPLEGAGFESSVPRKAPGVVPKGRPGASCSLTPCGCAWSNSPPAFRRAENPDQDPPAVERPRAGDLRHAP